MRIRNAAAALAAVLCSLPVAVRATSAESAVLRGGENAAAFSLALDGRPQLRLNAGVVENYDYDQAVWCDPVFVLADGGRIDATTLAPQAVSTGWGALGVNEALGVAKAAKVGGKTFTRFFFAHALSSFVLDVPTNAVRFEASVGLLSAAGKGSVVFSAETGKFTYPEKAAEMDTALDFDKVLFVRRKAGSPYLVHNWQSDCTLPKFGHKDDALCSLAVRGPGAGKVEVVYAPANGAFIGDFDLNPEGTKLLFSSIGTSNAWHVFELDLATRAVRQVTPPNAPDIDCYDPCYLPDGRIAFTCNAFRAAVPCVWGYDRVANLFRCDADGSHMTALTVDQEHAFTPSMLPDGRIMYLRWEYTDLPHSNAGILFTCNPDGSNQRALYGSNSYWPNRIFFARAIPCHPLQFVGTVTGHHGNAREGETVIFDVARGTHEADGAVQKIPGFGRKVVPVVRDQLVNGTWPLDLHPYPLTADVFLISRCDQGWKARRLILADRYDNVRTLLALDGYDCVEPLPLRASPRPRVRPDAIDPAATNATVYCANVYSGPGLAGIPPGTVKSLRVYTYTFAYPLSGGLYGSVGMDGPWDCRRILGTVPVAADGSFFFTVPAMTPVAVQPLDSDGMALQVMRSWFTARPGEHLSCVGCHEDASYTPARSPVVARTPDPITPWHGPARNFSFEREVQPVLDAYCVRCHDDNDPPAAQRFGDWPWKPDLRGTKRVTDWRTAMAGQAWVKGAAGNFSVSYANLHRYVRRPGIESEMGLFLPMEWHASTTELFQILRGGRHHGVTLPPEAWDRLVTWMDLNAPFHGQWSAMRGQYAVDQEKIRAERRLRYAGMDQNDEAALPPPPKFDPAAAPRLPVARRPFLAPHAADLALRPVATNSYDLGGGVKLDVVDLGPFALAAREITNGEFRRFDPYHSSRRESRHGYQFGVVGYDCDADAKPVVRVSWEDATNFCAWLSARIGRTVRLPTEPEWMAAAGPDVAPTNFAAAANLADATLARFMLNPYAPPDSGIVGDKKNIYDNWIPQISTVDDGGFLNESSGRWAPNALGLADMYGNVAEWTSTFEGPEAVVKGGSWHDRPKNAARAARRSYKTFQPVFDVGFRVLVEPKR